MPGFTTHYIFGMKAYNDMPNSRLKHIVAKHRWLYQLGLQGPDMFFLQYPYPAPPRLPQCGLLHA